MPDAGLERYVDLEDALNRIRGNRGLYKVLLQSFLNDPRIDELVGNIERGDLAAAAKDAHTIKGVSANLSLTGLNEAVAALELQLKSGGYRKESLESCLDLFEETRKAIGKLVNEL